MNFCSVDGCGRKHAAKGYCHVHYQQLKRTGEVFPIVPKTRYEGNECTFWACRLKAVSNGLCKGHDKQQLLGKPLAPLKRRGLNTVRDALGRKLCQGCDEWKYPTTEFFGPSKVTTDGLEPQCRRCRKNTRLIRDYGISIDMYERMLESQDGKCAIESCTRTVNGDGRELHVDHDHSCCPERGKSCGKCVRGLLCYQCNTAIGLLDDDPVKVTHVTQYLLATKQDV